MSFNEFNEVKYMIEFKGELSEKNQKIMSNKIQRQPSITGGCVSSLILAVIVTVLMAEVDVIFAIGYIPCGFVIVVSFLPVPKKNWHLVCPQSVVIDDEGITSTGIKFSDYRLLSQIKRIDDCGDYYKFWFEFPHQSPYFLCQKDLIVQGSNEEFEEMFADKIVRKYKK